MPEMNPEAQDSTRVRPVGLDPMALLPSPQSYLRSGSLCVSLCPAVCHRDPLIVCLCIHTYLGVAPSWPLPWSLCSLGPTAGPSPPSFCPLPHSETFSPGIET